MFQCEKCGCCCQRVGEVFFARSMALPDGTCKHFDKDTNLCRIYNERPIICRVDDFYDKYLSDKMSREAFYRENKEACRQFQAQSKLKHSE